MWVPASGQTVRNQGTNPRLAVSSTLRFHSQLPRVNSSGATAAWAWSRRQSHWVFWSVSPSKWTDLCDRWSLTPRITAIFSLLSVPKDQSLTPGHLHLRSHTKDNTLFTRLKQVNIDTQMSYNLKLQKVIEASIISKLCMSFRAKQLGISHLCLETLCPPEAKQHRNTKFLWFVVLIPLLPCTLSCKLSWWEESTCMTHLYMEDSRTKKSFVLLLTACREIPVAVSYSDPSGINGPCLLGRM